jgi:hypothetical protein
MAKKTRKQKQRVQTRRPQAAAPRTAAAPSVPVPSRPASLQILPESVEPLPGSGGVIESEPVDAGVDASVVEEAPVVASDGSARRRVQRLNPTAPARSSSRSVSTAAIFLPLESDDAAIPFDRVPYVPRDLRRVAIMASLMIVLILIAAIVVTRINP